MLNESPHCRLDRSAAFREAEGCAEWRDLVFHARPTSSPILAWVEHFITVAGLQKSISPINLFAPKASFTPAKIALKTKVLRLEMCKSQIGTHRNSSAVTRMLMPDQLHNW